MSLCAYCTECLTEPYIKCAECVIPQSVYICTTCFAQGREFDSHRSDHSYEVIKDDLTVFPSTDHWTTDEEMRLLDGLAMAGYGNWSEVSNYVATKSRRQCREHYCQCYIDNPHPMLPAMVAPDVDFFHCPLPFRASNDSNLGYFSSSSFSSTYDELGGYCAPRGDFTVEHNDHAELDVKDIDFTNSTDDLEYAVQIAALRVYRNVLKERHRRKLIVRRYGLINMTSNVAHSIYYEKSVGGMRAMKSLKALSQLIRPLQWDFILEGLHYETMLRRRIDILKKLRESGIKTFRAAQVHDRLYERRKKTESALHLLTDILNFVQDDNRVTQQQSVHRRNVVDSLCESADEKKLIVVRRTAPPRDYAGFPDFEKLSHSEKELCSSIRLIPERFLEIRKLMVDYFHIHGQVKLANARAMCKIDVNKTRKIYNHLLSERVIQGQPGQGQNDDGLGQSSSGALV